jgi:hypothetical protein
MKRRADIPDHTVTIWVWSDFTCSTFGLASPYSHKHNFKVELHLTLSSNEKHLDVGPVREKTVHKMHPLKQNHGVTVLTKCVICRGENVYQIEVSVVATRSCRVQRNECLCADILGPRLVAAVILSVFSDVRTVLTALPEFFCCRSRGSKILYPVLDGVVIRNRYVPVIVKTSSDYSLHYCHRFVIF